MKTAAVILLLLGAAWIGYDCTVGFSSYQHMRWIAASQNLPGTGEIQRSEASDALRNLCLDLNTRHRIVLLPACLMLLGGGLLAFARPKVCNPSHRTGLMGRPSCWPRPRGPSDDGKPNQGL